MNREGVRLNFCGMQVEGQIITVDEKKCGERNILVESWRAIGDGRYSWWQAWYFADELTLDLSVRRPVEALNALDCALATDDGSESEALAERVERLTYWLNGIGGYSE